MVNGKFSRHGHFLQQITDYCRVNRYKAADDLLASASANLEIARKNDSSLEQIEQYQESVIELKRRLGGEDVPKRLYSIGAVHLRPILDDLDKAINN